MKPRDTQYSEFREFRNSAQMTCLKCGPRNGDGMVNVADLKSFIAWETTKNKLVRVMVNDGTGTQWYSIPLGEFLAAGYWIHGFAIHAYYLVPKERVIPQAQQLEPKSTAKAEKEWITVTFPVNAKAATIHAAIDKAGLHSPFLLDRTNRPFAIKIRS